MYDVQTRRYIVTCRYRYVLYVGTLIARLNENAKQESMFEAGFFISDSSRPPFFFLLFFILASFCHRFLFLCSHFTAHTRIHTYDTPLRTILLLFHPLSSLPFIFHNSTGWTRNRVCLRVFNPTRYMYRVRRYDFRFLILDENYDSGPTEFIYNFLPTRLQEITAGRRLNFPFDWKSTIFLRTVLIIAQM